MGFDWENTTYFEYIKKYHFIGRIKSSKNTFYLTWQNMRQRCINPKNPSYKWYGERGISFLLTIEDIIQLWFKYKAWRLKKPSIDRIDNNGHYTLENCRFIELSENVRKANKERNKPRDVINFVHDL